MIKKNVIAIGIIIIAGLILGWSAWVSNCIVLNRVAIAAVQAEVKSELNSVSKTLDIHYGLLKEIRDNQRDKDNRK